jgi:preprotein translocase subunit SecG
MENVLLIVLLLLALALIGVVLLQRSEGGGLGMGGGGGGGVMTGRSAGSALSKVTWILGIAFMAVALLMTVLTSRDINGSSVVDQLAPLSAETAPVGPAGADLLPPAADEPATPRAD